MFPVKEYLSLSRAFITTQKSFATSQTALRKKSTYEYEPFSHLREAIGFKFHSRKKGNQERQKAFSLKLFQTSSECRHICMKKPLCIILPTRAKMTTRSFTSRFSLDILKYSDKLVLWVGKRQCNEDGVLKHILKRILTAGFMRCVGPGVCDEV